MVVGLIVGGMSLAVYTVIIAPYYNIEEYSMWRGIDSCTCGLCALSPFPVRLPNLSTMVVHVPRGLLVIAHRCNIEGYSL